MFGLITSLYRCKEVEKLICRFNYQTMQHYCFLLRKFPFRWKVDFLAQDLSAKPSLNHTFIYPSIRSHLSVTGVTLILCDASSQTIIRYICKLDDVCRFAVFAFLIGFDFNLNQSDIYSSCVLCVCFYVCVCVCRSLECLTWSWSPLSYITLVLWRPSKSGRTVTHSDSPF